MFYLEQVCRVCKKIFFWYFLFETWVWHCWWSMWELQQSEDSRTEEKGSISRTARRPNLLVEIPSRSMDDSNPSVLKVNLPPTPGSTTKTKIRSLIPWPSFKNKASTSEGEKTVLLTPVASSKSSPPYGGDRTTRTQRSFSLTKVFVPLSAKRTSSLPVSPATDLCLSAPDSIHGGHMIETSALTVSACWPFHWLELSSYLFAV